MNVNDKKVAVLLVVFLIGVGFAVLSKFNALEERVSFLEDNPLLFNACDVNGNCELVAGADLLLNLAFTVNNHTSRDSNSGGV